MKYNHKNDIEINYGSNFLSISSSTGKSDSDLFPIDKKHIIEVIFSKNSVSEAYWSLKSKYKNTRISDVYFIVNRLLKEGFLNAGHETADNHLDFLNRSTKWSNSFSVFITQPFLLYILNYLTLVVGLYLTGLVYNKNEISPFMSLPTSGYSYGIPIILISIFAYNLLVSLYEVIAHSFVLGKFPRLKMTHSLFGPKLRVDEGYLLTMTAANKIMTVLASHLIPLIITSLLSEKFGSFYRYSFYVQFILFLIYFSPFVKSTFNKILNWTLDEQEVQHLIPFLKNRSLLNFKNDDLHPDQNKRYAFFSTYSLVWIFIFYFLIQDLVLNNIGIWISDLQTESGLSAISLFVNIIALSALFLWIIYNLFITLSGNLIKPILLKFQTVQSSSRAENLKSFSREKVFEMLKNNPLFLHTDQAKILKLANSISLCGYRKNTNIIIQNSNGSEMYFLIEGDVIVEKTHYTGLIQPLAKLSSGSFFGELALFNKIKRTASVRSITTSVLAIMNLEMLQSIFSSDELEYLKKRIRVADMLISNPLFSKIPIEIIHLFIDKAQLLNLKAGTQILTEGQNDSAFFIILNGTANVLKDGQKLSTLSSGDFFGEIALLDDSPRTATVVSTSEVELLKIEKNSFWEIIEENMALAILIEEAALSRKEAQHVN